MYALKEKTNVELYKGYSVKLSRKKETEVKKHIAHIVGNDIANNMQVTIKRMSTMIARNISGGNN